MPRTRKILLVVSVAFGVAVGVLILAAPSIQRSFFYPKPSGLPLVVGQTTDQLLTRLQRVLETNARLLRGRYSLVCPMCRFLHWSHRVAFFYPRICARSTGGTTA